MCNSVLELHQTSVGKSHETVSKEREIHLGLTGQTIDAIQLRSLLEHYAPLQLLVDRTRPNRLRLSKKILSVSSLMAQAYLLLERAKANTGDDAAIDRLACSINVDKRSLLPHPQWTPRHDAVLVLAITRHGWIEQESARRAISDDAAIKWGSPFDADAPDAWKKYAQPKEEQEEVRATAKRAALFFNRDRDIVNEYKGFNKHLVQRSFGLACNASHSGLQQKDALDLLSDPEHVWSVDDTALETSLLSPSESKQSEVADLPETKDLIKRAATVLSRWSCEAPPSKDSKESGHAFAVIDQSIRSNILLAEMLRGLVKATSLNKHNKRLCAAAYKEACDRLASINDSISNSSEKQRDDRKRQYDEMKQVVTQIDLVNRNLSRSTRQYKNVLRVMLGEEPVAARNSDEGLFPADKSKSLHAALSNRGLLPNKTNGNNRASGELAIEVATRRLYTRSAQENSQIAAGNSGDSLNLTEVEMVILAVACSRGLPVWSKEWQRAVSSRPTDLTASKSVASFDLTWSSFGRFVSKLAQRQYREETKQLKKIQAELSKRSKDSSSRKLKSNADQVLWNAQRLFNLKEQAAEQAVDYAAEPDTLAKKTVMMLAKVQSSMGSRCADSLEDNSGMELGAKVVNWLDGQITSWASCLDLLDHQGRPLCFTANDFIDDLPLAERSSIEVSAILDAKGSQGIVNQIALMTRIRFFFLNSSESQFSAQLEKASQRIANAGASWVSQPDWWAPRDLEHDTLLLKRLVYVGFENVLDDTECCGFDDIVRWRYACFSLKHVLQMHLTYCFDSLFLTDRCQHFF